MELLATGSTLSMLGTLQTVGIGLAITAFVGSELRTRFGLEEVCVKSLCLRTLCQSWPETLALLVIFSFALLLRLIINPDIGVDMSNPVEMQAWTQIKREWPVLLGAETLISLQGMLRLLVWAIVAIRLSVGRISRPEISTGQTVKEMTSSGISKVCEFAPLAGSAAVLSLGAATARTAVYQHAQHTHDYNLVGPLGGALPVLVEAAAVPLLTAIATKLAGSGSLIGSAIFVGLASLLASSNYFNFSALKTSGDYTYDKLFILAHCLELLASIIFVSNTVRKTLRESNCEEAKNRKRSAWDGFVHLMLPCQQALSAYFWLTAVQPRHEFVGAGRPWCLVTIGSLIQLAAYLCAFAFHLAQCLLKNPAPQEGGGNIVQQEQLVLEPAQHMNVEPEHPDSIESF